ncbi:MAG: methyltransferase domain-containing protein [Parvibaculum sp.]|nr:methyltransferase domain-containing protein [Parvibaculum sp.]
MSEGATINLATVGTAELEAMSTQVFASCLDGMSGEAIARFKRLRKLSAAHRSALQKYLDEHPEKMPGGEAAAPAPKAAKDKKAAKPAAKAAKGSKAAPAAAKPAKPSGPSPLDGITKQMRAWWVGVAVKDLEAYDKAKAKAASANATTDKAIEAKSTGKPVETVPEKEMLPTLNRAELLQMIWGDGFALPGGKDFTAKLMTGVELPKGAPLLDISAGLGGGTSAIATQLNVVVEGYETDPDLAEAGQSWTTAKGVPTHASVICADPTVQTFTEKTYSAIFARETLFTMPDRKKLLANIVPALKPLGTIVLTDFMLTDRKSGIPEIKAWRDAEPVRPMPYTVDEYSELLDQNKFSVRACDDLSTEYIAFIQSGWKRLHAYLQTAKFSPETATMLMNEGNVWLARCKALESGQLRLISIKGALRPVRSMSDAMSTQ